MLIPAQYTDTVFNASANYTKPVVPGASAMPLYAAMEYWRHLKAIRKSRGLTQANVAEAVGVEQPTVQRWESNAREPSLADLGRLADLFGISVSAFFVGHLAIGPQLYVKGAVAAGIWAEAAEWPEDEWLTFTGRDDVAANLEHRFGLRVVGDSMNDIYPDGSIVECVSLFGRAEATPGKRVAVLRQRDDLQYEATIKELREINGELWLVPRSSNPVYRAIKLGEPEPGIIETRIIAVVVASVRVE